MGTLVLQPGVNTLTFRVNPLKRGLYALKGVQARVGRAGVAVPVEEQRHDLGRGQQQQQRTGLESGAATSPCSINPSASVSSDVGGRCHAGRLW